MIIQKSAITVAKRVLNGFSMKVLRMKMLMNY
jgi:hypothetical protein